MSPHLETHVVTHKFSAHRICPHTETLIVGTFNPDAPNNRANFFYASGRNYLWRILPAAFGKASLEKSAVIEKMEFIRAKRIDFIDLINSVEVNCGQEGVRSDIYISSKVRSWTNVIDEIDRLPKLRRACFTRKTLHKIPEIKSRIEAVSESLRRRAIKLKYIVSPARYYSVNKQKEWAEFLTSDSMRSDQFTSE